MISPADAAKISLGKTKNIPYVEILGELKPGDAQVFFNIALKYEQLAVILQSPGGDLQTGLDIGKAIRLKQFTTVVPSDSYCYSACALLWLGGVNRVMGVRGEVGFHAAYYKKGKGDATVSSVGNAEVGAYINQLGLPDVAVRYLTTAQPDDIAILSPRLAGEIGISVDVMDEKSGKTVAPSAWVAQHPENTPTRAKPRQSDPEEEALMQGLVQRCGQFATQVIAFENGTSEDLPRGFSDLYAPTVRYYGVDTRNSRVLADKLKLFSDWPSRTLKLNAGSKLAIADDGESCQITAAVDYAFANPGKGKSHAGQMKIDLTIFLAAEDPMVIGETMLLDAAPAAKR